MWKGVVYEAKRGYRTMMLEAMQRKLFNEWKAGSMNVI